MLVFIDESGDPGFKIADGSSHHFVIALVIFDDELDAEEVALKIKKLRRDLKKSDHFEFKFGKCNKELRVAFLNSVRGGNFRIRAMVFAKDAINNPHLRNSRENFYKSALKEVLKYNGDTITQAKIRLDGSGNKLFRQNLINYLRKSLNSDEKQVMQNLRFRDSSKDVLIQLSDMVVGSIRRYYDAESKDYELYIKLLRARIEKVKKFE